MNSVFTVRQAIKNGHPEAAVFVWFAITLWDSDRC